MSQQFQVPQFIEHEARLIGPFTIKQTALLTSVGAVLFVLWFVLEKWLFVLLGIPISFFALLLGFMKVNGRPLLDFFASFFSFFISPQLFIWQKRPETVQKNSGKKHGSEIFEGASTDVTKKEIMELAKKLNKEV
ncbi:MAG: PrgI family protein [Candidatus Spechtbacterales bacterium]